MQALNAADRGGANPSSTQVGNEHDRTCNGCCGGAIALNSSEPDESVFAPAAGQAGWLGPCERITEHIAEEKSDRDRFSWGANLPVIIVPGFLSSALTVRRSTKRPDWENERLWFALGKLGVKRQSYSQRFHEAHDRVIVEVHEARGVAGTKGSGCSDPFARVTLLDAHGQHVGSLLLDTKVVHRTDRPVWEEQFTLGAGCDAPDMAFVHVEIFSEGTLSEASVGSVCIPLAGSSRDSLGIGHSEWHKLEPQTLRGHKLGTLDTTSTDELGEVRCTVRYLEADGFGQTAAELKDKATEITGRAAEDLAALKDTISHGLHMSKRSNRSWCCGCKAEDVLERKAADAESKRRNEKIEADILGGNDPLETTKVRSSNNLFDEASTEAVARSAWLQHVMVGADGQTDPDGIEVRPVQGLRGCDYLGHGTINEATTWVMGPLIQHLKSHGYTHSNLRAAPYDWRVSPQYLQQRDGYFTKLVAEVERLYDENEERKVVLLGHSMGCKVIHYFSHWVVCNPPASAPTAANGATWLAKYLHGILPIGGPFLGAPKSLRAVLSGDTMGLDMFLNDEEMLTLNRGLAGSCFLLPEGPLRRSRFFDPVYVKQEGVLLIEISHAFFEDSSLQDQMAEAAEHLRVTVGLHKNIGRTHRSHYMCIHKTALEPVSISTNDGRGPQPIFFSCQFVTNTQFLGDQHPDPITIKFQRRSSKGQKPSKANLLGVLTIPIDELFEDACDHKTEDEYLEIIALARSLHAIVDVRNRYRDLKLHTNVFVGYEGVEGLRHWLHHSHLPSTVQDGIRTFQLLLDSGLVMHEACQQFPLHPSVNSAAFFVFDEDALDGAQTIDLKKLDNQAWLHETERFSSVSIKMRRRLQLPHPSGCAPMLSVEVRAVFEPASLQRDTAQKRALAGSESIDDWLRGRAHAESDYDSKPMLQTLARHGASDTVQWRREYFLNDPAYLKDYAFLKPPPVPRCFHIYGTKVETEFAYLYRSLHAVEIRSHGPKSLGIMLDDRAVLQDRNFRLKDGVVYETPSTPQELRDIPGQTMRCCGDGTVPYQSLRYSRTWDSTDCLSQTLEIADAEHRAILNDKRLFTALSHYLAPTISVYVLEARNVPALDRKHLIGKLGQCDPYVKLTLVTAGKAETFCTATVHRSLQPIWNEAFTFGGDQNLDRSVGIRLDLYDRELVSADVLIGQVWVPFTDLLASPTCALNGWAPVTPAHGIQMAESTSLRLHIELERPGVTRAAYDDAIRRAANMSATMKPTSSAGESKLSLLSVHAVGMLVSSLRKRLSQREDAIE